MKDCGQWALRSRFGEDVTYVTHGAKKWTGFEIELNLPIKEHQALDFLKAVVTYCRVKEEPIQPNIMNEEIFGLPVVFRLMPPLLGEEKLVLRLIFPDENGKYPEDRDCQPIFKRQLKISQQFN